MIDGRFVPFNEAKHGDLTLTYDWRPMGDDYGWVSDTEMFDDIDEPVTTTRKTWRLVGESKVTFHPATELCPACDGEGDIGVDCECGSNTRLAGECECTATIECGLCEGDGQHPLAGQVEVHP